MTTNQAHPSASASTMHNAVGSTVHNTIGQTVAKGRDHALQTDYGDTGYPTADVLFYLEREENWPPYEAETISCELMGNGAARLTTAPWFASDVSCDDIVTVHHDGAGLVAQGVELRGGHSTVHVMAANHSIIAGIEAKLGEFTVRTVADHARPMLTIDVPSHSSLNAVCRILDDAVSVHCNYAISCRQHESFDALASCIRGRIVTPTDVDWDHARSAWNLAVDQRPEAVVFVADTADVAAVIRYAASHNLRVAPQSGGHNPGPLGDLRGTILLRTAELNDVVFDITTQTVRAGSGALWGDVNAVLAGTGYAALSGSSPDVGISGYTLSGGYSWLGRSRGLACSSVTAVELVTGDGRIRRVDADHEPDLFWSVRGGGGNHGVVTGLEFQAYPIAEVTAGSLLFPIDRAREVFLAFDEWTRDLDDCVTACVRLLRMPPLPELPDFLRGQSFVVIDGAIDAPQGRAAELLAPLRALAPVVDLFGEMPTTDLAQIHMDPPTPTPCAGDGLILQDMPVEAIDSILAVAGPAADTTLLAVDIRLLGGALGRPAAGGGVVDHLPGRFLAFGVGVAPDAATHAAVSEDVAQLIDALQPWAAERTYANFSESTTAASRFYSPTDLARLIAIRDQVDPLGVIRANHPLQ
ncbi:FAD-binding protein [Jatrophihabitans sp. DSM 45814]